MYANTIENTLTDGSHTYDVVVNVEDLTAPIRGRKLRFTCVDEEQAHELQDLLNADIGIELD